jgi:hypothetical protein
LELIQTFSDILPWGFCKGIQSGINNLELR